ncbi:Ankyrin repeat-containing domain protein [Rhypophila decipiens]
MTEGSPCITAHDGLTNFTADEVFQGEFFRLSNIFFEPEHLTTLPVELILEIIEQLAVDQDSHSLANLALTCRITHALSEPILYSTFLQPGIDGQTPNTVARALIYGALHDLPGTIQKCVDYIKEPFNVDSRYENEQVSWSYARMSASALHVATDRGSNAAAALLLRLGTDVNARGMLYSGRSLYLHDLRRFRDTVHVPPGPFALLGANCTPLHFALTAGNTTTALILMQRKACFQVSSPTGHLGPFSAVHMAATQRHDPGLFLAMLDKIKDGQGVWGQFHADKLQDLVDFSNGAGAPLHYAVVASANRDARWRPRLQQIRTLLDLGADVDAKTFQGPSPISLAVQYGLWEAATVLLQRGASITPTAQSNSNPVIIDALWSEQHPSSELGHDNDFQDWETGRDAFIRTMISTRNVQLDGVWSLTGETPLTWVARHAKYKSDPSQLMELLLEQGASLHLPDRNGDTALHALCDSLCLVVDKPQLLELVVMDKTEWFLSLHAGDSTCLVVKNKAGETFIEIAIRDPRNLNTQAECNSAARTYLLGSMLQHSASSSKPLDGEIILKISMAIKSNVKDHGYSCSGCDGWLRRSAQESW